MIKSEYIGKTEEGHEISTKIEGPANEITAETVSILVSIGEKDMLRLLNIMETSMDLLEQQNFKQRKTGFTGLRKADK